MDCTTMVVAPVTNIGCCECAEGFAVLLLNHRQTRAVKQQPAHQPNIGD